MNGWKNGEAREILGNFGKVRVSYRPERGGIQAHFQAYLFAPEGHAFGFGETPGAAIACAYRDYANMCAEEDLNLLPTTAEVMAEKHAEENRQP